MALAMTGWRSLAQSAYEAAVLLAARHWRSSVSRAYFAAYSIAAALLAEQGVAMPKGREGPSHRRVAELVENHLKRMQGRRWPAAGLIRRLYGMRVAADYQPSVGVGMADARQALVAMVRVIKLMQEKQL